MRRSKTIFVQAGPAVGGKVELQCKAGYANNLGEQTITAECKCENGSCAMEREFANWGCVSGDDQQVNLTNGEST